MPAGPEQARARGDPRGRIPGYRPLLLSSLLLAVALASLSYLWALENFFPDVSVVELRASGFGGRGLAAVVPPRSGPRRSVRILQPRENIECARRHHFDLWSQADRWRRLARAAGFDADFRDERGVPRSRRQAAVLVVPWVLCLDPATRGRIDAFRAAGGGLVLAGHAGLAADAVPRRLGRGRFVLPAGRSAPAAALDPGRRLELPAGEQVLGLSAARPVLYWSRWNLEPLRDPGGTPWSAAVLSPGSQVRGRAVWFGFPVARGVAESRQELDRLRVLALLWAGGDAVAAVSPWPEGRSHAAVVAVDARPGDPTGALLEALALRGLRPSLYVFAGDLGPDRALRSLARHVPELASRSDRPAVLAGETRVRQGRRLRQSRREIHRRTGRMVRGLHPPEERLDDLTLHEAGAAGYGYLLGDPDYDRAYPRWAMAGDRRLALLPRPGPAEGPADPRIAASDVAWMRQIGGLALLSLRSDVRGSARLRRQLRESLDALRTGAPWLATADEVVDWAAARRGIALEPAGSAGGLRVTNGGANSLAGAVLELFGDRREPQRLPLPALPPGGSYDLDLPRQGLALATP